MELMLGEAWNPVNGSRGRPVTYDFSTHATVIAPTGSGKGVGIELPNLLTGFARYLVPQPRSLRTKRRGLCRCPPRNGS